MSNQEIKTQILDERANENVIRIVAFQVVVLTSIAIYFQSYLLALFLALDFSLRAFGSGKYSILKHIGIFISKALNIPPKLIFAPPKKFAASLGFVFSLLVAAFFIFHFNWLAIIVGGLLVFCAILESLFGICIGCYVYTFINKFK
jgi:hypothetical protein